LNATVWLLYARRPVAGGHSMPTVPPYEFIGQEATSRGRRAQQQAVVSAMRNMLLVCAVFVVAAGQPLARGSAFRPRPARTSDPAAHRQLALETPACFYRHLASRALIAGFLSGTCSPSAT
jgi:hypothetical protein